MNKENLKVYTNELKPNETLIYLFARAIDGVIKDFYKDPKNVEAFEKWKANRDASKAVEGGVND